MTAHHADRVSAPPADEGVPAGGVLARMRARGVDVAELGVSAFLFALGVVVLIGTTQIAAVAQRGPVGPKVVPAVIGVALLIIAVWHAIDVARGGHGEAEAGEDIELGAPADWLTVGILLAGFVGNILLMEPLGWPLSGALMFFVISRALGARSTVRDAGIALVLGFVSYYLFADLLELSLPAGVLEGVI
jgi:putative tricarboxylic transport membrane protein